MEYVFKTIVVTEEILAVFKQLESFIPETKNMFSVQVSSISETFTGYISTGYMPKQLTDLLPSIDNQDWSIFIDFFQSNDLDLPDPKLLETVVISDKPGLEVMAELGLVLSNNE